MSGPHADSLRFGELAVLEAAVSASDLEGALNLQSQGREGEGPHRHKIGTILIRQGLVSKNQAQRLLKIQAVHNPVKGYQILERLGSGGMGIVYRALQLSLRRTVALKVLDESFQGSPRYRQRFLREARMLGRLRHTNLVACIDRGDDDGNLFMAMEYVDGSDLKVLVQKHGPTSEANLISTALDITRAMEHYDSHGVIHRDIKPDNIIVAADGTAKLTDLGLALDVDEGDRLTADGRTLGTPLYISPELARGQHQIDIRSDIYSLGATLYFAATGEPVFTGDSVAEIVRQHARVPAPPVRSLRPELSAPLARCIDRMLAKRPSKRFDSPGSLLVCLERIRRGGDPFGPPPRRRFERRSASPHASKTIARHRRLTRNAPASGTTGLPRRSRGGAIPAIAISAAIVTVIAVAIGLSQTSGPPMGLTGQMGGTSSRPGGPGGKHSTSSNNTAPGEVNAAQAWLQARELAEADPLGFDTNINRFDELARRYPGTPEALSADEAMGEAIGRREALAARAVLQLRQDVEQLLAAGRRVDAMERIAAFPGFLRGARAAECLDDLRREASAPYSPSEEGS